MRRLPLKLRFFVPLAALSVVSLPAFGAAKPHAHKALAHATAPAHQKPAKAERKPHEPAKPSKASHKPTKAETRASKAEARATKNKARPTSKSRRHQEEEEPARPALSRVKTSRHHAPEPEPKPVAHAAKPAEVPRNEPDTTEQPLPAIVTHHDRHVHLAPVSPSAELPTASSDKATSADFMKAAMVPAESPLLAELDAVPLPPPPAIRKHPAPVVRMLPEAAILAATAPVATPAPVRVKELIPTVATPYTTLQYDGRGHLIVPAALKGSHEILLHQNAMADQDGLDRVQDDEDLERMRAAKLLVAIPDVPGLDTDERLPMNRRYTRPWTAAFLASLAKAHYARFHSSLQVNSAVRTVEFQQKLLRTNGNAAPAEGSTASPHLTGQAVDLAKHGLSMTEIAWMRGFLLPLEQEGKIDVEEEFQQACFHISVYRKFVPQAAPRREIAPARRRVGTSLAAAIE